MEADMLHVVDQISNRYVAAGIVIEVYTFDRRGIFRRRIRGFEDGFGGLGRRTVLGSHV